MNGTLLLDRHDIRSLLGVADYLEIVDAAFRAHAQGKTLHPGLLHIDTPSGEFHIKAGGLERQGLFFGLKVNGGFFGNRSRFDMPNIQGTILLCNAENGYPLALMDSVQITLGRTGATTAVAARHLARADSRVLTICGCGSQGRAQMEYLSHVLPLERVFAFDSDRQAAIVFAAEMSICLGIPVTAVEDYRETLLESDVCVTCTPSREPLIHVGDVRPGTFIAAIGADSPEKQELDPHLLASSTVVVDLLEQCASVGELRHALELGLVSRDDIHAELGQIVNGDRPGRTSSEQVIILDATGTALQDTAAAAAAYGNALSSGLGRLFDFFATESAALPASPAAARSGAR